MNIVFAHPVHRHDSYSDYRRLALLSGFEVCLISEIDLEAEDTTYIISPATGDILNVLNQPRRCKVIWWNLERIDSGSWPPEGNNASNAVDLIAPMVDKIWVSDRHHASLDARLTFVPMGSHIGLAEGKPDTTKLYDIVALTYNNARRKAIYDKLGKWKVAPATAWGETRARLLNTSRCMVYVHQTPALIGAPLRFALAAAYKLPVISELMADPYPLQEGRDFVATIYEAMVELVDESLSEGRTWTQIGDNLHHTLCIERNFRSCIADAVMEQFP